MPVQVNVDVQVKRARKSLKNYEKKQLPAATTRALNRTLRGTMTDTKKLISKRINLAQGRIAKDMRKKPASAKTGKRFTATMIIKGDKKPNIASFKGLSVLKKKGLSGKPWRTRVKYPGAFVWERKIGSGSTAKTAFHRVKGADKVTPNKGAYANRRIKRGPRKGEKIKRQPIKPLFGDSVVGVFLQTNSRRPPIPKILRRTIPKRFAKELRNQLKRIRR